MDFIREEDIWMDFATIEQAYFHGLAYGSLDKTREIACMLPSFAYYYARNVDKCPHEETRRALYSNSEYAYYYAIDVDRCSHRVTRER